MDISLSENDYSAYDEVWIKDEDSLLASPCTSPHTSIPSTLLSPDDDSTSVLCGVCKQTFVSVPMPPSKRTRPEQGLVCEDCLALTPGELPKFRHASARSKRVVKREHAKRRTKETDSEAVRKLKIEQEQIEGGDMPEPEKKRLYQIVRNRISAQQSRDRKKAYVDQLEQEKRDLESKNLALEQKIARLKFENRLLKQRIAVQPASEEPQSPLLTRTVRNVTIALATVISVMAFVQGVGKSEAFPALELKDFRNTHGVTVEEATTETLRSFNLSIEDFVPAETVENRVDLEETPNLLDPALYFDLSSIRGSLAHRIKDKAGSAELSLRGSQHPCDGYRELLQAYESNSLATMFCPNLSFYTAIGYRVQDMVRMVQMVVPVEAMAESLPELRGMDNCYVELLCKVLDVSVVSAK